MVASSQTIVHGRVVDVRPYETAGRRSIETLVTVQVVEALKGEAGATVYFKLPGGQVGRYRRVMIGVPQSAPGDEVVLFLKGSVPAVPMPFGLTQVSAGCSTGCSLLCAAPDRASGIHEARSVGSRSAAMTRRFICLALAVAVIWLGIPRTAHAYIHIGLEVGGQPKAIRWNVARARWYATSASSTARAVEPRGRWWA